MKTCERISKMEDILNRQNALLADLNAVLDRMAEQRSAYAELAAYYYSAERHEDIEADNREELPDDLRRGVLSEDAIYNMICDYDAAGIRMVEMAADILKSRYN